MSPGCNNVVTIRTPHGEGRHECVMMCPRRVVVVEEHLELKSRPSDGIVASTNVLTHDCMLLMWLMVCASDPA